MLNLPRPQLYLRKLKHKFFPFHISHYELSSYNPINMLSFKIIYIFKDMSNDKTYLSSFRALIPI